MPRIKRERNPKVKTPWDGVFRERADELLSGGVDPKARAAESDITDICYLQYKQCAGNGIGYKSAQSAFIWCFAQLCNKNAIILFRAGSLIIDKTNVVVSQNILLIIVSDSSIIQSYKGVFVIEDIPEAKTAQDMIVDFCK